VSDFTRVVLAQEPLDYEIRVDEKANDTYGAFPVGSHDDLCTALGLAVPYTLHAQEVMAQAGAGVERLPAVLAQVQRALEHAGLHDTFRLLPDLDLKSAHRSAKSYLARHTSLLASG
jgi:hypothetical protein